MSSIVSGELRGLSPSQIRLVERLGARRLDKSEIVSLEFAREIYGASKSIGRRIGALVSREGIVEDIIVGTRTILYLPDLGRYRLGPGRLRRLRLIFGDLSSRHTTPQIPQDIVTDLIKLRLDAAVAVKDDEKRVLVSWAHLLPDGNHLIEEIGDLSRGKFDFAEFISELEGELSQVDSRRDLPKRPKAVLIGVYKKGEKNPEESMAELRELARTAGVDIAFEVSQVRTPDPRTVLGRGKLEEVILRCLRDDASLLIFDTELKPSQWRAVTNATELKVIDRSMLILDIFSQRASSSEGRLQVELAQLRYNLPKLVEKDAGLSRLTGGIGGRGPGETKLEIGRRRIRERISLLEGKIEKVSKERALRRTRHVERAVPVVAILGYTNVGKSTLFNVLTKSDVLVENKLFATLDPAKRRLFLPDGAGGYSRETLLIDTVGFIRDLPKELRNAFRATLEEIGTAALILHVVDATDSALEHRYEAVRGILSELGYGEIPEIIVINKCDKVDNDEEHQLEKALNGIAVSALTGRGLGVLRERISRILFEVSRKAQESKESSDQLFPA